MEVELNRQIAFNVGSLYIKFHGPFPKEVMDAADSNMQFTSEREMLGWLYRVWPKWKKNVAISEGLF